MNTNEIPCPSCGAIGFIRWDANKNTYSCYVCDSITPPAYVPQEELSAPYQVQITPNKEMATDFLEGEEHDSDEALFEEDPFEGVPDWEADETHSEDPGALLAPVYQDGTENSIGQIMPATKSKKGSPVCARCGSSSTQRGGKIKRLYGENKDICLACHRNPTKVPPVSGPAITEGAFVLFDNGGAYVGRFSTQEELAKAATKLASFEAFRLQPLKATMTVRFED